jgi:nucleotide-binding universal stress UspA family protein
VIEQSSIPVFAIPDGSIKKIDEIRNLLYATDFDPSDYSAINRLLHILSPLDIQLHCLHVSVGMKKPWDPVKMEELKEHLTNVYSDKNVIFSMQVSPDIISGLESYIRNNSIDAIALVNHKKGPLEKWFAPSMTKKIFTETGKPLFVFHAST